MDLTVSITNGPRNISLQNPVLTASGTFGFGVECADVVDINRLGGIVAKTATLLAREGNAQPRIAETPSGMLNSIGLQNPGLEAILVEKAPIWATWDVPVFMSIAGENAEEFAYMTQRLDGVPGVAGVELNLSCPNVAGGLDFGIDPVLAAGVVGGVRRATNLPVIAKLTPNVTDILPIAKAAADAGADALSLTNTLVGMAMDVERRRPILANVFGGLSGPAIKPVSLAMVYKVVGAVDIPVIGIGGIRSGTDAIEFLMAGAAAVQVGTGNFIDPQTPIRVSAEIEAFMADHEVESMGELIGAGRQ